MRNLAVILILITGCTSRTEKQEITSLDSTDNVYLEAYEEVKQAYANDPSEQLVDQKLYYLEKLGWPPMAINALEEARQYKGLSKDLVKQYILYYEKNDQYAPLMELLNNWGKLNDLDESMMEANIRAHMLLSQKENTIELLNEYLYEYDEPENQAFVADKFLKLEDTLMSIYHYSKLYKIDPSHKELVNNYVPLLLKVGEPSRARTILSHHAETDTSAQTRLFLSKSLYQMGDMKKAKGILRSHNDSESLEQLTRWYWKEKKWDSTMVFVNKLIELDSSKQALMMKASIYEESGSLQSSLELLNLLIEMDPADNLAREMAQDVSRKISYLRQLEEKKNRSIPEISPKTSLENE